MNFFAFKISTLASPSIIDPFCLSKKQLFAHVRKVWGLVQKSLLITFKQNESH